MTDDFYDSAELAWPPGVTRVMLPVDGEFAVSKDYAQRFERARWYTVTGDYHSAGTADFEAGNLVYSQPGKLYKFVAGRIGLGHRARVYASRTNMRRALDLTEGLDVWWWVPTLQRLNNGQWWKPSAVELAADLRENWDATVPVDRLWANQYAGGPHSGYDISQLYQRW
jgi:hypothetical protein